MSLPSPKKPKPTPLQTAEPRVNNKISFGGGNGAVSTRGWQPEVGWGEDRRGVEEIGDVKSKRGLKRLFNEMMKGGRLKD